MTASSVSVPAATESAGSGRSVVAKLAAVAMLGGVLLIGMSAVSDVVQEREGRRAEAIAGIHAAWSARQAIAGPVVVLRGTATERVVRTVVTEAKPPKWWGRKRRSAPATPGVTSVGVVEYVTRPVQVTMLPERLDISGALDSEIRYRGIYETNVYTAALVLEGGFAAPDRERLRLPPGQLAWTEASLAFGLSDLRGVQDAALVLADGAPRRLEPRAGPPCIAGKALAADVPPAALVGGGGKFRIALTVRGSQGLSFVPAGKITTAALKSRWPSPNFVGEFLPVKRHVGGEGFDARWRILDLNTGLPDSWAGPAVVELKPAFGVDLPILVDSYRNTLRATKYAALFIFSVFLTFLFLELVHGLRIHPIQYSLVGAAVAVFFLLLLSVSEHASFQLAYLAGSVFVLAIIGGYVHATFGRRGVTSTILLNLTALYTCLYTILQAEDFALLLGSCGIAAGLALVMFLTRKLDWYKLEQAHRRAS